MKIKQSLKEDAVCQTDRTPWNGRAQIQKGLEKAFADLDTHNYGNYPFLHVVTNHLIEITGPTTAKGKYYLIDLFTERPVEDLPLLLLGLYVDDYELIDGKWYIASTRLDIAWPARNI
nr:nuclear transport factor 2 family protein [uncultured Draconibacterium sp.]